MDDDELDSNGHVEDAEVFPVEIEEEQEYTAQERVTMDLEIPRQPIPEPSDGEVGLLLHYAHTSNTDALQMYLLKVPDFMSIEPRAWDHTTFQPPTTDHHSRETPSATFSAYNTALSTIRWRHSPSSHSELQSNARINRWEDGSLTLQLASDPTVQYEIDANALVPPQRNPIKPTPTSIEAGKKSGRNSSGPDTYTYLFRPHEDSSTLIVAHKLTAGLQIKQSGSVEDDAIERLQASLAAAANASKVNGATGLSVMQTEEDPERAKLEALQAMKDKEKADKKRQAAIDREAARNNRAMGRMGSGRYSGLNVGMLEDDELGETNRGRPSPNKARGKPRRRRNSEYSEDEDFGRKRFSREDEYDEEDDFVAPSDEEEAVDDGEEDSDDGIVEDDRQRSPKRQRDAKEDDEADAPGEEDDAAEAQATRTKRRKVVVDEEEEDE